MAEITDGTVAGCVEFLGYLMQHGYQKQGTASAVRTGVNGVRQTVEGIDDLDLRNMDLDDVLGRYRLLAMRNDIKMESITEYERRFRQARDWYLDYLNGGNSWKATARVRSVSSGEKASTGKRSSSSSDRSSAPAGASLSIAPDMITHTVPLKVGGRAQLVLPEQLSDTDAERICNVIRALAFKEQLALPVGTTGAA